jgi:hypothetical protein
MTENFEVVFDEPPESARFVTATPSSAARYVVYSSSTSLLPASYDQVMKNQVVPVFDAASAEAPTAQK